MNVIIKAINKYAYIAYGLPVCERGLSEAYLEWYHSKEFPSKG